MSLLEQRYRNVLRLLPGSYRAQRGEEMVASFLEAAGEVNDEDDPRPGWSETVSVAALALRVRLGDVGRSPAAGWGAALRLAGLLGLLYQASLTCWSILTAVRLYTGLGFSVDDRSGALSIMGSPGSTGRLTWVGWNLVDVAVIVAYVMLVRGHRRTGRILALLLLASPVHQVVSTGLGWPSVGHHLLGSLLTFVTVVALLVGFHQYAPAVTYVRRWLTALPVVAAVYGLVWITVGSQDTAWPWVVYPSGVFSLFLAAAGGGYACLHTLAPHRRAPAWPLALALLAAGALGALLGDAGFPRYLTSDVWPSNGTVAVAVNTEAVIAAVSCLGLAALARLTPSCQRPAAE